MATDRLVSFPALSYTLSRKSCRDLTTVEMFGSAVCMQWREQRNCFNWSPFIGSCIECSASILRGSKRQLMGDISLPHHRMFLSYRVQFYGCRCERNRRQNYGLGNKETNLWYILCSKSTVLQVCKSEGFSMDVNDEEILRLRNVSGTIFRILALHVNNSLGRG